MLFPPAQIQNHTHCPDGEQGWWTEHDEGVYLVQLVLHSEASAVFTWK